MAALGTAAWLNWWATATAATAPTGLRDTLAGTVSGISLESWGRLLPLIWTTGAAFLAGGVAASVLAVRGAWRHVLPAVAVATLAVLGCAARGLVVLEDHFSLKELALIADRDTRPDTLVACAGQPIDNPSILFYINREVHWVGILPLGEFATRQLGIGRALYLTDDAFLRRWADRSQAVYLIVEQDMFDHWKERLLIDGALPAAQWLFEPLSDFLRRDVPRPRESRERLGEPSGPWDERPLKWPVAFSVLGRTSGAARRRKTGCRGNRSARD